MPISEKTVEDMAAVQQIKLADGRAARIARGLAAQLETVAAETHALPFELEPPAYLRTLLDERAGR